MRIKSKSILGTLAVLSLAAAFETTRSAAPNLASDAVLSWVRFDDATQAYKGTRYLFLGDRSLHLTFTARPDPNHVLGLLWGAKNDTREAVMTVNGQAIVLRQGGYDGFQWLKTPVPAAVTGERYEVSLKAGAGTPAFIAEIRLLSKEQVVGAKPDVKASTYGVTVRTEAVARTQLTPNIEAFPEMRKLWDREPAPAVSAGADELLFRQAERNARLAAEGLFRCRRFVDGWLAQADPATGLIPRNLRESRDFWNGRDAGADNYPFMVLTAAITDRPLLEGRLLDMLRTETKLTSRVDRLPDDFSFSKQGWRREKLDLDAIIFDGAEYVKDGLIPLTEWLGPSPWSERMIGIIDDIWKNAPIETPFGKIPTLNFEVNGDLLQACSRLYWFTGKRKYLDWAIRLGDCYLCSTNHPTRDLKSLRLMDHGCEVVNGLTELYVACTHAVPAKKKVYEKPLHEMFDCILAKARNEHGLLYTTFNPQTGEHAKGLCDTWGYNYDGVYTTYLVDRKSEYRDAVRQVLGNLKAHYTGHDWGRMDGYADSLEGVLNLFNREPIASAGEYVDSEIRTMWGIQKPDGVIEGWHGDGNFARTTLMYVLWKTQGAHAEPWRADLRVGAVRDGDTVFISLAADLPWSGRLLFDKPRHKANMHLPLDYPRINQFPEWFVMEADRRYVISDASGGVEKEVPGKELQEGITVELKPSMELRWRIKVK